MLELAQNAFFSLAATWQELMRRAIGFFKDTANLLHKGKQPNVQKFLCAHAFQTRANEHIPFFLCNLISVRHVAPKTVARKLTVLAASFTS
jgi:hypothetical protein